MSEHTDFLIRLTLETSVPLMIKDIEQQGGVQDWQLERVSGHAVYLGEHGDALQYYVKGESAKAMKVLIESVAIAAFVPGGITFSNLHFEGQPAMQKTEELTSLQVALAGVK